MHKVTAEKIEELAEKVHNAYIAICERFQWDTEKGAKRPYSELDSESKELGRAYVRAVLDNI